MPKKIYLCPSCGKPLRVAEMLLPSFLFSSLASSYQSRYGDILDAAKEGTVDDVRYFVELRGESVNTRHQNGNTPLHYAANFADNITVVRHLIRAGAVVNARKYPPDGQTPLDMVEYNIHAGSWKIGDLLMESGGVSSREF